MKKTVIQFFMVTAFLMVAQVANAQSKLGTWKELKDFHQVMSQTFHPSEEGNLQPIKERSGEMVEKAGFLAKSSIPVDFNRKEVLTAIEKLASDSKELDELIKADGTDEEIKSALAKLHDVFHEIVGLCSSEDKH